MTEAGSNRQTQNDRESEGESKIAKTTTAPLKKYAIILKEMLTSLEKKKKRRKPSNENEYNKQAIYSQSVKLVLLTPYIIVIHRLS